MCPGGGGGGHLGGGFRVAHRRGGVHIRQCLLEAGHTALPQLAVRDTAGKERLRVARLLLERCVEVTQRLLVLAQLLGAEGAEVVLLPLVALLRRERLAKGLLGRLPLPLAVVLVATPHGLDRH